MHALQIELTKSPMSSADGNEVRGVLSAAKAPRMDENEADQENLYARKLAPGGDADRPPLRLLPQGRPQHVQRPRPKLPGTLNLTRKLPAPVRKAVTPTESATKTIPSEPSLPGKDILTCPGRPA